MNIFAVVGVRVFFVAAVVMSGSRTVSCIVACSLFDEDVVDGLQICCGQLIGQIFSPIMGIFGLPGEAATVLLGGWMSMGGGVGVAVGGYCRGA